MKTKTFQYCLDGNKKYIRDKWHKKSGVWFYNGFDTYVVRNHGGGWPWGKWTMHILRTSLQCEYGQDSNIYFKTNSLLKLKKIVALLENAGALTPVWCINNEKALEEDKKFCMRTY